MIQGVRNFKLINAYGAEYDMTRPEALFIEPDGLGWGLEADFDRIGSSSYVVKNTREKQANISGNMAFRDYKEYQKFLDFVQVGNLTFCYMPIEKWRYIEVIIDINKSEIEEESNHLICPVTLIGTSFWYEKVQYETITAQSEDGKVYPYTYPYTYSQSDINIFDINVPMESFFKLQVIGECQNPQWRLIKDDEVYMTGKINATIPAEHKLVVNTDPDDMEISEYTLENKLVRNLYGSSDFTTERLFSIPKGQYKFSVTATGVTIPKVYLEVKKHV